MLPFMLREGWARFRSAIGFLSDLGGAVLAVAFGLGVIVAAVILAAEFFPIVPLILVALGAALVVFGVVVRFLGPRWHASAQIVQPVPTGEVADRYAEASALQENYYVLRARKAARLVREELVDNQAVLQVMRNENRDLNHQFSRDRWVANQEALLEYTDPRPFRVTQEAYRRLERLDGFRTQTGLQADHPDIGAKIESALGAIGNAIRGLEAVETEHRWQ